MSLVPVGAAAMQKSESIRERQPTPSPLRKMADPTAHHIMPSRAANKDRGLMLPPPAKPKVKKGQEALDEDTFVEAMGDIIERDFFPDLPRLHRQMMWIESIEKRRIHTLSEIRRVVASEQRKFDGASSATPLHERRTPLPPTAGATPTWSISEPGTPLHGTGTPLRGGITGGVGGLGDTGAQEGETKALPLSLDQFLARYQSEDDASFDTLAEKMRVAHRRKYWWVYEHPTIEAGSKERPLYLLPSGEFMTEDERKRREEATDAKPRRGDDRPGGVETWTYRPRNSLLFQPELEQTVKVHEVNGQRLMIEGPKDGAVDGSSSANGGVIVVVSGNARVGEAVKAPKEVVHHNTRFGSDYKSLVKPSPIERAASAFSTLSTDTAGSTEPAKTPNDGFVPMTPMLIPGAGGQSPPMTWGEIDGTPLRVTEPFDEAEERAAAARRFRMQEPRQREKVATALETARRKKGATPKVFNVGGDGRLKTPTPLFPLTGGAGRKRTLGEMTPAAQSLAARLVGQQADKAGDGTFGGGVTRQLRASYGGGGSSRPLSGLRSVADGVGGGKGGVATPLASPMVPQGPHGKRARQGGEIGSGSGGGQQQGVEGGAGQGRRSLTHNLLDI